MTTPATLDATRARTFAIGDIHGDLDALLRILLGLGLLTDAGEWAGGNARLVLLGDLNDRGRDSASVVAFVMRLQEQATHTDGRLDCLLGNHEALAAQGDYRYVQPVEVLALEEFWYGFRNGPSAFFRGESPYAVWLRGLPTMLVCHGTLFVHAGLGRRVLELGPDRVNDAVRAWIAHFQGAGVEPAEDSVWLIDQNEESPIWSARFDAASPHRSDGDTDGADLAATLASWGVRRIVVGHRPTRSHGYRIVSERSAFGAELVNIDTGISWFFGGQLSALEFGAEGIAPRYFDRGDHELDLTARVRAQCRDERNAVMEADRARSA